MQKEASNKIDTKTDLKGIFEYDLKEGNEELFARFLMEEEYELKDMEQCRQKIFDTCKYDSKRFCFVSHSSLAQDFKKLDEIKKSLKDLDSKSLFCIYRKPKCVWILICFIFKKLETVVLYKDSLGSQIPEVLEQQIKTSYSPNKIIIDNKSEMKQLGDNFYGPFCLRNLKKLVDLLGKAKNIDDFIEEFPEQKFCTIETIYKDKNQIALYYACVLSENKNFLKDLKQFVNAIPTGAKKPVADFMEVVNKQLEKKKEDDFDLETFRKSRDQLLNHQEIQNLIKHHKMMGEKGIDGTEEPGSDIEKTYRKEMSLVKMIFLILGKFKRNDDVKDYIQKIAQVLTIDKDILLKNMFDDQKKPKGDKSNKENGPPNIAAKRIKESKDTLKSLDELLTTMSMGMDTERGKDSTASQAQIEKIKDQYNKVNKSYKEWENNTSEDIWRWSNTMRKQKLSNDIKDVCNAIGIMSRAIVLSKGYTLRIAQLLGVLVFFNGDAEKGKLVQIKTGEGKTMMVALLATIRILQGYTVDVITSNSVLAKEGVKSTKEFFSIFNLTVGQTKDNQAYKNDILYGDISNFQFDYLRDLTEGSSIRENRKFHQVILDEVDSMLIDNGGNIAKLSSPFPGMECLRYIYIKIWQELLKAEELLIEKIKKKVDNFFDDTKNNEAERDKKLTDLLNEIVPTEKPRIKDAIKKNTKPDQEPLDPLVPKHLKEYVKRKLEIWIDNAMYAKYECHENEHYRLMKTKGEKGEMIVAPVDYLNTGVTLENTIWSNGLHQFVQLKHNVHLTYESLTSSFISNVGYIKKYPKSMLFGMTGTLGSRAEQQLLGGAYGVEFAKIPTHKKKAFKPMDDKVVDDAAFPAAIVEEVETITKTRAILVLLETIKEVDEISALLGNQKKFIKFVTADTDIGTEVDKGKEKGDKGMKIGDVIFATNIGGRGTDLKIHPTLNTAGGLHVCIGFLPCNQRVEEQAFGRTSRKGENGSGRLIIKTSEVENLGLNTTDFKEIRKQRDEAEGRRIEEIKKSLLPEIDFKDKLFDRFSRYYCNLKEEKSDVSFYKIVLKDLTEFWASWLDKKSYKGEVLKNLDPDKCFAEFKSTREVDQIQSGEVAFNPFYAVAKAEKHIEKEKYDEAWQCLEHALKIDDRLPSANLKLFEILIDKSNTIHNRIAKALKSFSIIALAFEEKSRSSRKDQYLQLLRNATHVIENEISYNQRYCTVDPKGASDFNRIIVTSENPFLVHHNSRFNYLITLASTIDMMKKNVEENPEVMFQSKVECTKEEIQKTISDEKIKANIEKGMDEIEGRELQNIGLDTIYVLKNIKTCEFTVTAEIKGFMMAGIAAIVAGFAFPPIFTVMCNIGTTLISEGIVDLVVQALYILAGKDNEFKPLEYAKQKFIGIAISLATFAASTIAHCKAVLSKAVSFCRKVSSALRKSKHLKELCEKLAQIVDKLGNFLQKRLEKIMQAENLVYSEDISKIKEMKTTNPKLYNQWGGDKFVNEMQGQLKMRSMLSQQSVMSAITKNIAKETFKKLGKSIVVNFVGKIVANRTMQPILKGVFAEYIKMTFESRPKLKNKLENAPTSKISEAVVNFIEYYTKIWEIEKNVKEAADWLRKKSGDLMKKLKVDQGICDSVMKISQISSAIAHHITQARLIMKYVEDCGQKLEKNISGSGEHKDLSQIMSTVSQCVAEPLATYVAEILTESDVQAVVKYMTNEKNKLLQSVKSKFH